MEIIFGELIPWLLWTAGGCLILLLIVLSLTNRYTKRQLKKMERENT